MKSNKWNKCAAGGKGYKGFTIWTIDKKRTVAKGFETKFGKSIQNAPSGNLKIINCRGVEQYYLDSVETRTSYPNGKYLRKSDLELAGKLAQRNYDKKLLSEVEKQLKNIQNIIRKYEK